jgi:transcriptional regulatory protein GAL4
LGNLESLVTQLLPGIDIEAVLASPELAKASLPHVNSAESEDTQRATSSRDVSSEPVIPEAVPNSAKGFEWKEEDSSVDVLADGMAALSVEPSGVGYLGISLHCYKHVKRGLHVSRLNVWSRLSSLPA